MRDYHEFEKEQDTDSSASLERSIDRVVVFSLDGQSYALPIGVVQEIQQIVALTDLPDTSPALVGLVNMRGIVLPAIDLRTLLGLRVRPYSIETPMIICRVGDSLAALIVDEVDDVMALPDDCIQPPSRLSALADKMLGVCRLDSRLVFLFDVDRLLPVDELSSVVETAAGGPDVD